MAPLRVLVVDDSPTVRGYLVDVLAEDPNILVVGEADNGGDAFDRCRELRPDVVSLDMMMPRMDGVEATERIMAYCPTPILIVSSSTNRGEAFKTYDALTAGALEVLEKPRAHELEGWGERYRRNLRMVGRIKVMTHPRAKLPGYRGRSSIEDLGGARGDRVVAIGASTGGPAAVVDMLSALPATFPWPVLLVLHLPELFAAAFTEWLDGQLPLPVRSAEDRAPLPEGGVVLLPPPDRHLSLRGGHLHVHRGPERHSCRPSVDVLFEAVATEVGSSAVACLLTGMGRDGAAGMAAIRAAGGLTLAQDAESAVVHGMPGAAIEIGAASEVLTPRGMADRLLREVAREPQP